MDKHSGNDSDSSGEFIYDNPFLLEDDKFEREFEKTLALFDALLIGEDSLNDTFSLSSSPNSTLKYKSKQNDLKSSINLSGHNRPLEEIPDGLITEERPKSFLHDEVSEFNRLLKELSDNPLKTRHSSSSLGRSVHRKARIPSHQHSLSIMLPTTSFSESLEDVDTRHEGDDDDDDDMFNEGEFNTCASKKHLLRGVRTCGVGSSSNIRASSSPPTSQQSSSHEETYLSDCPDYIKRQSYRTIIESGFFETPKNIQSQGSTSCDGLSYQKPTNDDRGSHSLECRPSSQDLIQCISLQLRGINDDDAICLSGKKDGSDSAYQTGSTDTLKSTSSSSLLPRVLEIGEGSLPPTTTPAVDRLGLEERLSQFNRNKLGLVVKLAEGKENIYHGMMRIHLNLIQPINMCLTPSSLQTARSSFTETLCNPGNDDDINRERVGQLTKQLSFPSNINFCSDDEVSLSSTSSSSPTRLPHSMPNRSNRYASFYVPPDVSKVVHVTSESTTANVIKILLNKFLIVDSSKRFALFQRTYDKLAESTQSSSRAGEGIGRPLTCHMRKLREDERPLEILMRSVNERGVEAVEMVHFVLQEYSTGEIIWDAFSVPELNNFLMILAREEQMKIAEVEQRFTTAKVVIRARMEEVEQNKSK